MRRIALMSVVGLAVTAFAACSVDETDFKDSAEKFINDDDEVSTSTGTDMSAAECEQPESTEVGTLYGCTASGADGTTWQFTVRITGDNELTVVDGVPVE